MNKNRKFLFGSHRVLGTLVSFFFLMWFVTGLVLLYHPFPNVTKQQKYEKTETLPADLPSLEEILNRAPDTRVNGITIRQFQGQTLLSLQTPDGSLLFNADTTRQVEPVTFETIQCIARQWVDAPVLRVDTLYDLEQWIMYTRYIREMPIYKFYFDDPERHQLYISSRTGEVQQFTSRGQRLRAWAGHIPHTFYFPFIRKHVRTWINILTVSGFLSMAAALTGMILGMSLLLRRYKRNKSFSNPYRKKLYRWHYASGLLTGLFIIGWGFSGAMSLQRIPQWMVRTHHDYKINASKIRGKQLPRLNYPFDYRQLPQLYPGLKEVRWSHFQDIPVYTIITGDRQLMVDASTTEGKELFIPEESLVSMVHSIHGKEVNYSISWMEKYDQYYLSRKNTLALPVYKVEVEDLDNSVYYITPRTGDYRYINNSRRLKKWMFSGLHYLNIQFLIERPVLWTILIWALCSGGVLVTGSGVWMGVRYLRRKLT